jgi:hypothetical protein
MSHVEAVLLRMLADPGRADRRPCRAGWACRAVGGPSTRQGSGDVLRHQPELLGRFASDTHRAWCRAYRPACPEIRRQREASGSVASPPAHRIYSSKYVDLMLPFPGGLSLPGVGAEHGEV